MSDSSVEQIANKNSTVVEKYISKYRSNITKTINNNLSNLQGTDFSSIGVLGVPYKFPWTMACSIYSDFFIF